MRIADLFVDLKLDTAGFLGDVNKAMSTATRAAGDITIDVKADTRGLSKASSAAADKAGKEAGARFRSSISSSLKGLGGVMAAAFAGKALVSGFTDVIGKASELEQSIGGVQAVFGKGSKGIEKSAKSAANNLGLSRDAYNKLATTLGAGLKNKGIEDYAGSTQKLITIGGDLAAQFGGSTQEAVDALSSAMRGESDPIEKYGVALNETAVAAKLAAMGAEKAGGKYTEQQKTMARLALITDQTKDAQGAFGREGETAAGRQAKMTAAMDNLKTTIGSALLPAFSGVVNVISDFVTGMDQGSGAGGRFKTAVLGTFNNVKAVVVPIITEITGGIKALFASWAANDGDVTSSGFAGVMERVGFAARQVFDYIANTAIPALKSFGGFLLSNKSVVLAVAAGLGTALIAMQLYGAYTRVMTGLTIAWSVVQRVLNGTLRANPIGIVVTAISLLVAALVLAYQKSATFRDVVNSAWATIKTAISGAWNGVIKPALAAMWSFIQNTLIPAVKNLWNNVVKPVFAAIGAAIAFMWNNVVRPVFAAYKLYIQNVLIPVITFLWNSVVKPVFAAIGAAISWAWNKIIKPVFAALKWYLDNILIPVIKFLWNSVIKPVWASIGGAISTAWNSVIKPIFEGFKTGLGQLQKKFEDVRDGIGTAWDKLKGLAKAPIKWVIQTVIGDTDKKGIIGAFNWLSDKIGGPHVAGVALPKGFAAGGVLPGYTPGRDVHQFYSPTAGGLALSGGEAIMRPEFTRMVGGASGVDRLNAMARRGYASGGIVDLGRRLQGMGYHVSEHPAFGGVARGAHTTNSQHYTGNAIDVNADGRGQAYENQRLDAIVGLVRSLGFSQIWRAPNHFDHMHIGTRRGGVGGAWDWVKGKAASAWDWMSDKGSAIFKAVTNPLGYLKGKLPAIPAALGAGKTISEYAVGAKNKLLGSAVAKIKELWDKFKGAFGADTGVGTGVATTATKGANQALGRKMMLSAGFGANQWGALRSLWQKESGWNHLASNGGGGPDSGRAYGIPQSLPGKKMASSGSDWRTNPRTQIDWGLKYIKGRYGDPAGAWTHSMATNWYDRGGWLQQGRTMAINKSGSPEAILTSGQWSQMERLVAAVEANQSRGGGTAPFIGHAVIRESVDLERYERQRAFRERMTRV